MKFTTEETIESSMPCEQSVVRLGTGKSCVVVFLRGRLAGRSSTAVLASILVAHGQAADAAGEEGKRIVLSLRVEVVSRSGGGGSVAGRLESGLGGTAIERTSRVRARSGTEVGVQRGVRGSTATEARGESVGAGRTAEMLAISARRVEATGGSKGTGRGVATHGSLVHAVGSLSVQGRWVAGVGDHSSASTARSTAKTAHVLSEVVVAANLITALPVTGTERDNTRAAHTAVSTAVTVMAHVRRSGHHSRGPVSIAIAHLAGRTSTDSWERAAEAGGAALEVGETARGARPVTRSGAVLARREGREDLGGAVQNPARGGRHLDSLLVQGPSVHAKTFSGLKRCMMSVIP